MASLGSARTRSDVVFPVGDAVFIAQMRPEPVDALLHDAAESTRDAANGPVLG